jgi:hypothetical protein
MRVVLFAFGIVLLAGGMISLARQKPYSIIASDQPATPEVHQPSTTATMSEVDYRVFGYPAIAVGMAVLVCAVRLRKLKMPEPHKNPVHHDM